MRRTQLYLKEEQCDYLLKESLNKWKNIAGIIRELIDVSISSERNKLGRRSFWNVCEDGFLTGIKNGSVSHDKFIYINLNWILMNSKRVFIDTSAFIALTRSHKFFNLQ